MKQQPPPSQEVDLKEADQSEGTKKPDVDTEAQLKAQAKKMAEIWKKPQEPVDPEKLVEAELDEFLEDMFM